MLRAIIFDFNGVIADDEPLHLEIFRRVLAEEGLAVSDADYYESYLGRDDRGCFAAALADAGRHGAAGDAAYIGRLIARKADYYEGAACGRDLLFPEVPGLARRLAARYPLAIASGALRREIELWLARAGIADCFAAIVAAEDVLACKPDPEGYLRALAALNAVRADAIRPHECLAVEDSVAGVEAARHAGMRVLAVTNSYPAADLRAADWVVPSLAECDMEALW